ncbi:hypothetical protein D3C78_760170 [compost metagenome]
MAHIYESSRASYCAAVVHGDVRFFCRGDLSRHLFIYLGEIQEAYDSFDFVDSSRIGSFGVCIFYHFAKCIYERPAGIYTKERSFCGVQTIGGDVQSCDSNQSIPCTCVLLYSQCGVACGYSSL